MRSLDTNGILRLLPHRYPMLLIDRVLDYEPGRSIRALKNVTMNEPYFAGHFPAYPVMPGVIIVEAMAQAAGLLTMLSGLAKQDGTQLVLFAGIDKARFKRQVLPGDTLVIDVELERSVRLVGRFRAQARVGEQVVCEATLLAAIRDVPAGPAAPA